MGLGVSQFGANTSGLLYTLRNGLTEVSPGIGEWGGTLIHNTTITQAGFNIAFSGGAFYAIGSTGATPVSGFAFRMMWIPAKAAFRAGVVTGTQWDDANIGSQSVSFGGQNTSSGTGSFTGGSGNVASGAQSFAFGSSNNATGTRSMTMGVFNDVTGSSDAIAIGGTLTCSADQTFAWGSFLKATAAGAMISGFGSNSLAAIVNNTSYSYWIAFNPVSGKSTPDFVVKEGAVGIGNVTAPTARLHLQAGTATAATAPLKFNSGVNLTSPELGAVEYDGNRWYGTITGPSRQTFAFLSDITGTGDFVGPASATDNAVVRFDGTTGKLGQNSVVTVSDAGDLVVPPGGSISVAINTDSTAILGFARLGNDPFGIYLAYVSYYSTTGYALFQSNSDGAVALNSPTGALTTFRKNNATKMTLSDTNFLFADTVNIAFSSTGTGSQIGEAANQLIALWGKTPIVQPASADQAALTNSTGGAYDGTLVDVATVGVADPAKINDNFTDIWTLLNAMRTAGVDFGSIKGSA